MFRYEEKRWVPKDGSQLSPSSGGEEYLSTHQSRVEERNGHVYVNKPVKVTEERKSTLASSARETRSAGRISIPSPPKGAEQVRMFLQIERHMFYELVLFQLGCFASYTFVL